MNNKFARNKHQEIVDKLSERRSFLENLRKNLSRLVLKAPDGALRVCSKQGNDYFYLRNDPTDTNGRYIPKSKMPFIEQLAQKDYDRKVLEAVLHEEKAIDAFLKNQAELPEELYYGMHPALRALVAPIEETDEEYVAKWLAEEYEPFDAYPIDTKYITDTGKRVRSKSELIIANSFHSYVVPYKYECPLWLEGYGTARPDFTALNVRLRKVVYWEHLGMMDDPDYANNAVRKISAYIENGYLPGRDLILTFETQNVPLNTLVIGELIKAYCL